MFYKSIYYLKCLLTRLAREAYNELVKTNSATDIDVEIELVFKAVRKVEEQIEETEEQFIEHMLFVYMLQGLIEHLCSVNGAYQKDAERLRAADQSNTPNL